MFHITVALARFFELLLLDMVKSAAGLVLLGAGIIAGSFTVTKIIGSIRKRHRD